MPTSSPKSPFLRCVAKQLSCAIGDPRAKSLCAVPGCPMAVVLTEGSARISHKPTAQAEDSSAPWVLPLPIFKKPLGKRCLRKETLKAYLRVMEEMTVLQPTNQIFQAGQPADSNCPYTEILPASPNKSPSSIEFCQYFHRHKIYIG